MNGAEHYRRAEALLLTCQLGEPSKEKGYPALVESYPQANDDEGQDAERNALAAAMVHATLAQAAATLELAWATSPGHPPEQAWADAVL